MSAPTTTTSISFGEEAARARGNFGIDIENDYPIIEERSGVSADRRAQHLDGRRKAVRANRWRKLYYDPGLNCYIKLKDHQTTLF